MKEELLAYEVMVIFKPLLPDDVRKGSHKSIVDLVKKLGGDVVTADVWGKRYLANPIKSHDEGYYIVYELKLPSGSVDELRLGVDKIAEVLRFMVTRTENPEDVGKKLNKKVIEI